MPVSVMPTGEPKKRSKLFPFLRRRKDKGKSKSLTDLSLKEEGRRSGSRERANRSFRLPGRQPTFDAQDLSVDKRNSAADSPRSSIGDRGSDVEKDPIIIDDDNESDRKESSEEEDSETENGENEQLETTSETVPEWPPGTTVCASIFCLFYLWGYFKPMPDTKYFWLICFEKPDLAAL